MRRRLFWPLIALGSILFALAAASFAVALFSDPIPRVFVTYGPPAQAYWDTEMFDRVTSLDWSEDRNFVIAAIVLLAAAAGAYASAWRVGHSRTREG